MKKKIKLPIWAKVLIGIFGSLIGLFVLVVGGGNIAKYAFIMNTFGSAKK